MMFNIYGRNKLWIFSFIYSDFLIQSVWLLHGSIHTARHILFFIAKGIFDLTYHDKTQYNLQYSNSEDETKIWLRRDSYVLYHTVNSGVLIFRRHLQSTSKDFKITTSISSEFCPKVIKVTGSNARPLALVSLGHNKLIYQPPPCREFHQDQTNSMWK